MYSAVPPWMSEKTLNSYTKMRRYTPCRDQKQKHFIKLLPEPPNTKSCKVAFLPPPPPLQCWETFWGNRQCSYKCGSLFIPLRKLPVATLFNIEMGWRGVVDTTSGRKLPCVAAAPFCNFPRPPPAPSSNSKSTNSQSCKLEVASNLQDPPRAFFSIIKGARGGAKN